MGVVFYIYWHVKRLTKHHGVVRMQVNPHQVLFKNILSCCHKFRKKYTLWDIKLTKRLEEATFTNPFLLSLNVNHQIFFCNPRGSLLLAVVFRFPLNCFNLQGQILISDLSVITGTWLLFRKAANSEETWDWNAISLKINQYFMTWKWQSGNIFHLLQLLNVFSLATSVIINLWLMLKQRLLLVLWLFTVMMHLNEIKWWLNFQQNCFSFLDHLIPFGVTGRMLEPIPAPYGRRQGTPVDQLPARVPWLRSCCGSSPYNHNTFHVCLHWGLNREPFPLSTDGATTTPFHQQLCNINGGIKYGQAWPSQGTDHIILT